MLSFTVNKVTLAHAIGGTKSQAQPYNGIIPLSFPVLVLLIELVKLANTVCQMLMQFS
jgi:hypothetical protein